MQSLMWIYLRKQNGSLIKPNSVLNRSWRKKIKGDTKSFFAYVRGKTKTRVLTGPLEDPNRNVIDGSKDMAEVFNEYFDTVFTNEVGGCMTEVLTVSDGIELSNILVTVRILYGRS